MKRLLPIALLAGGLFLLLTAFAAAAPTAQADEEVCAVVTAQVNPEPDDPKAMCWKKIGMGKLVPACPSERAILAACAITAPIMPAEAFPEHFAVRPILTVTGFDPPPPRA